MENWQLFWGINTVLLAVLGFFIKIWMGGVTSRLTSIESKLDNKVDEKMCSERLANVKTNIQTVKNDDEKGIAELKGNNVKDHDEIFERLRAVESARGL